MVATVAVAVAIAATVERSVATATAWVASVVGWRAILRLQRDGAAKQVAQVLAFLTFVKVWPGVGGPGAIDTLGRPSSSSGMPAGRMRKTVR